jgi:predicted MPP superfamily phosphohydrolase
VEYQQLVKVYEKDVDDLTEEDITWFNEVINNLTINNPSVIRWIGDTLADRGNNDYFVLKLLEKLKKTANVEILISNHDGKFIDAYRKGSTIAEGLGKDDAKSLFNLGILLENGLVKQREVNQLVEEVYKPSLRAISYTIDNSTQPPSITLFTHAPVGFETFEEMAKLYQIPYKDDTVEDLANTIDLINEAFLAEAVLKNDLNANHEVYQNNIMLGSASIPPQYPLLRLARRY